MTLGAHRPLYAHPAPVPAVPDDVAGRNGVYGNVILHGDARVVADRLQAVIEAQAAQLARWEDDSAAAWDKCEERRIAQEKAEAEVARLTEELARKDAALAECQRAVDFMDRVLASAPDEQIAVGRDHWNWVERACRKAAALAQPVDASPVMRDETGMEHIARDMREGRFPERSPRQQVPADDSHGEEG